MSDAKLLRKQLRNVVQELLPTLITNELIESLRKEVADKLALRMDVIATNARETLNKIAEDQKTFQEYVVRQNEIHSAHELAPTSQVLDTAQEEKPAEEPTAAPAETL